MILISNLIKTSSNTNPSIISWILMIALISVYIVSNSVRKIASAGLLFDLVDGLILRHLFAAAHICQNADFFDRSLLMH